MSVVSGWGRVQRVPARELASESLEQITGAAVLTRGLGRSYGDASLPASPGAVVATSRLANRILAFDEERGVLRAEAGLSLAALNRCFTPRRWFTPVSPGTRSVTLGGMVAADVHGKNHHRQGSFGNHVQRLRIRLAEGDVLECSPQEHAGLFRATIGGFGLTGHILEVELGLERIASPWILQTVEAAEDLEGLLERLRAASAQWPYTVSWVDCLSRARFGRGLLICGRWAEPQEGPARPPSPPRSLPVPFEAPGWLLNRLAVSLFNQLYYRRRRQGLVAPDAFFYPLDVLSDWNRLYGRQGFIQYQCVLPHSDRHELVGRFMREVSRSGATTLLCVIKDFGAEGVGMLSFPRPGFTISLDIPYRGAATQALVDRLNAFVIDSAGRIYLAKDGLTRRQDFRAMEPRLADWQEARKAWDPARRLRSALSARLFEEPD
jgi:FAD/FMN-containing dehydrogenase